jgi:Domain of unknown function (DUF4157)
MRTFPQKQNQPQKQLFSSPARSNTVTCGPNLDSHPLLHLQRAIGNQAMLRLLQAKPDDVEARISTNGVTRFAHDFSQIPIHSASPACVQAKLTVSAPGDTYEQEADRVADQVMRSTNPLIAPASGYGRGVSQRHKEQHKPAGSKIQHAEADSATETVAPTFVQEVLRSPGQSLAQDDRLFFEARFGHDFSRVRLHSDAKAAESAQAINALAYTIENHVVFGTDQYSQQTTEGRRLLAHELTHVVQQRGDQTQGNSAVGNRACGIPVASLGVPMLQRDFPPHLALPTPVAQKPYYRTDEAITDLRLAAEGLKSTPPDFWTGMAIVKSVYKWLDGLVNDTKIPLFRGPNRAEVASHDDGDWLVGARMFMDARNAVGVMSGKLTQAKDDMELEARGKVRPPTDLLDPELGEVELARDYLKKMEEAVSFELAEARTLPDVPSRFEKLTRSQMHVLAWLQKYKGEIAASATKFNIDRRAVAGAIAWEATEQVKSSSLRGVGPGKPHAWELRGKKSAVEEVEDLGKMPRIHDPAWEHLREDEQEVLAGDKRIELLKSVPTAIDYISAIMGAIADISEGFSLNVRNDPGVLATVTRAGNPASGRRT